MNVRHLIERAAAPAATLPIRTLLIIILLMSAFSVRPEVSFAQGVGQTHTVQSGEYLSTIAARYGVSVSALIQANGISNTDLVRVGQVLIIPTSGAGAARAPSTSAPPTSTPMPQSDATRPASTPAPQSDATHPASAPSAQSIPQVQSAPQPAASSNDVRYTVYPGESLSSIAAKYGTTASAIIARNGLPSSVIYSGQRLFIPAGRIPSLPASNTAIPVSAEEPSASATPAPAQTATSKPTRTATRTPTPIVPRLILLPTAPATPTPARR